MTQISATEVAKLRKITGAGMMDCKQALAKVMVILIKLLSSLEKKDKKLLVNVKIEMLTKDVF